MVRIYRFSGVRPDREEAPAIAAVPYDVVTVDEARSVIEKNNKSFLRVSRPDAELTDLPANDPKIYERARENFEALMKSGMMLRDPAPGMYLYRVDQNGDVFFGLCCCLDVEDYRNTSIRRHELTRYDKEEDRTRHIGTTKTHNGPVVLLYRNNGETFSFIRSLIPKETGPDAEVKAADGSLHRIYRIADPAVLDRLEEMFAKIPALYIADGHHRAKSAVNVADQRILAGQPVDGEVSRFMGVMFAHDRVKIHGYSRLLANIGTYTVTAFLDDLKKYYDVRPYGRVNGRNFNIQPKCAKPHQYHIVHMYLGGEWYECTRPIDKKAAPLEALDVAVLQTYVLEGLLGITDPRGDARLQYLGGARPVADLEKLVDTGRFQLAFAMQPVNVETVLSIADTGGVMPPKSTWFEPKLLSGLVVHTFE
ncbi:MAG: DUF1015 domain-containing protein [Methanomicrobiales archaeon]|nr:DUF1015 domain-containing protein [Methanomicrobiales archaeon]